jgi:hypothetical protein
LGSITPLRLLLPLSLRFSFSSVVDDGRRTVDDADAMVGLDDDDDEVGAAAAGRGDEEAGTDLL